MDIAFATRQVIHNNGASELRQTLEGRKLFCHFEERKIIAEQVLKQVKIHNQLNSTFKQKIRQKLNFRNAATQTHLQQIGSINSAISRRAYQQNSTLLDEAHEKLSKLQDALKNKKDEDHTSNINQQTRIQKQIISLQQEQKILQDIGRFSQNQQLLGFIGEAADALGKVQAFNDKSFGAHSFAILKDPKTQKITLKSLNTSILTETSIPVYTAQQNKFTNSLTSFNTLAKNNEELIKLKHELKLVSDKISSWQKINQLFFGKKEVMSTGAESGGAACCTITSLDELANIGQRTDHEHGEIITPSNGGEGALTGFVTYASVGGIKIASDIFLKFNAMCKDIKNTLEEIKLTKIENQYIWNSPQFSKQRKAIEACEKFLNKQKKEANFQKRVAGLFSALCSATILLGQFIAKLSPVGLYLLSGFGAGHMIHVSKQLIDTVKAYRKAPADSIEKHHLWKKIKNLSLALLGWTLYTAGTSILGTMSLGMFGAAIQTGAAPALVIAGITLLGVGILGTLIFNNIVTSKRFFPGLPMKSRFDPNNPPTQAEVQTLLHRDNSLRLTSKAYRKTSFHNLTLLSTVKNKSIRYTNKAALYITLGLIPDPFMSNKFKIKSSLTKSISKSNEQQNIARFEALANLFKTMEIVDPELKKDDSGTFNFNFEVFTQEKHRLSKPLNTDDLNREERRKRLVSIINMLEATPYSDQIMKIFSKKVFQHKRNIHFKGMKDQNGLIGQYLPTITKRVVLRNSYISALSIQTQQDQYECQPISDQSFKIHASKQMDEGIAIPLALLYKVQPCCNANDIANNPYSGILNGLRESYSKDTHHSQLEMIMLEDSLIESIDHFLLYQARNTAKEDIALHSQLNTFFE